MNRKRQLSCLQCIVVLLTATSNTSALLVPSLSTKSLTPKPFACPKYHYQEQRWPRSSISSLSRLHLSNEDDEKPTTATTDPTNTPQPQQTKAPAPPPPSSPSATDLMNAMGTSPRRIFLSVLSSAFIALVGNLFGVTSALLNSIPEELVEQTGLDGYYPRGGFKRYRGGEYGYTVLLPKEWVADTAVELAKAQRRTKMLDYSMSKKGSGVIPDAAFGPPSRFNDKGVSENISTNLSIVASSLPSTSSSGVKPTLQSMLGTPQNAAETLLRFSIAPSGSGRIATLVAACEETRGSSLSNVYQFEYDVEKEGAAENDATAVPRRAISVIAIRDSTLITMTVVAPRKDWKDKPFDAKLRKVAESFRLTR